MKPIKLTVAGLHSFREKQVIDFGSLCEGGVFGIFGPTGSGKSSILDAMTLALYGKVERASNNTLGILNHAEEQLHVSFTFELENANGAQRYMIERSFKRADEMRVKSSISRLIEIKDESIVLADKIGEVNQQIQELLGLTIDDFTRAVVLPQGKFAEFLSLKGVDRRQMLQRLFNLEQYGDKLNKKLRNKVTLTKSDLNEVTAEQAGLGDASQEAIKQAEKDLNDVEVLLEKRQKELTNVEEQFEKSKQIWEWQIEKNSLIKQLNEFDVKKDEISQLEIKLKHAEAADKVLPYIEEYEAANESVTTWTTKQKALQAQLETKRVENAASLENYHVARQEKAEKLPIYITKKQQLLDAKQVQLKVAFMENELADIQKNFETLTLQASERKNGIENLEDILKRAVEKQKMLKEEQALKTVSADYREEIRKAYEQKQTILRNKEVLVEVQQEKNKKQLQLDEMSNTLIKKNEEFVLKKAKMGTLSKQTGVMYDLVCEKEKDIEKLIAHADFELNEKKNYLEKFRTNNLAIQLAGQLKAGEACPVCGSTEHPNPQVLHDENGEILVEEIEMLTQSISEARELKQTFTTLKIQLEQISQGLVQEYPGELKVQINENPISSNLEFTDVQSALNSLSVENKGLQQDYLRIRDEARAMIQEIRTLVQQISQLENSQKMSSKDFKEVEDKATILVNKVDNLSNEWHQSFTSLEFDTIEKRVEEISQNDQELQELTSRIEKSVAFLEQKTDEQSKHQEEYNRLERGVIELKSAISNKEEALQELRERLTNEVGNNDVDVLLYETEQMITQLEEKEATAYEAWQSIQKFVHQLENEAHAATQSLKESENRAEKATKKWEEVKADTSFVSTSDVKNALLPQQEQASINKTIEEFKDKLKQLKGQLEKVNSQLNGEEISLESWEEVQRIKVETKQMVNEAVEAKGAAHKALQVLQDKHERFNELEERRLELEKLSEQYQKLQSVFKGNSFVEYIAEEQLVQVARDASERLGILTRQRYAVEVDSQGGFIMRDDANGGVRRPVTSLSGGETFLTSLALALSLSAQIQLRGEYPLQFFFLDEGFGTLDAELLDTVVTALEKLHSKQLAVGVISHVQELRARLPKRLIVEPAEHSGRGTVVRIETL